MQDHGSDPHPAPPQPGTPAAPDQDHLVVQELGKTFHQGGVEVPALVEVSFRAARGEFLAVMGASGSGKSTLLHLLAGLIAPTSGSVTIGGQPISKLEDRAITLFRRRHIGLVFQSYNLVPTLTVEDNVQLPLLMERTGKVNTEKCDALLEALGLGARRLHRPDQLSGGEQQRVAIARALINDPALLLADEPTGNLDSGNRERFCSRLRDLAAAQHCTVVLVTHDPVVAMWSDRVLLLRDGNLAATLNRSNFPSAAALGACFHELVEGPGAARAV